MTFQFSRRVTTPPNGFDLGDVRLDAKDGVATSVGHAPDQGMMIYVALTDLLDGLRRLVTTSGREFEFIGTDSSFRLVFRRGTGGRLKVKHRAATIGDATATDVARAALEGASAFLANEPLPASDPVAGDVSAAVRELRAYLE